MAQWFAAKADHPDALLFFRMGDFYELFFADAEAAAAALDIALSHRGEHCGTPIPMCGVPHHASEVYLARLIRRGFRVAIVEQMEDPKARTGKLPIKREVVRIITPGTIIEESLLEAGRPNLLMALAWEKDGLGAAWVDVSTGLFETAETTKTQLPELLGRLEPVEIVAPQSLDLGEWAAKRSPETVPSTPLIARRRLAETFGTVSLDAFGTFSDGEAVAAALAVDYIRSTQSGALPRLGRPEPQGAGRRIADGRGDAREFGNIAIQGRGHSAHAVRGGASHFDGGGWSSAGGMVIGSADRYASDRRASGCMVLVSGQSRRDRPIARNIANGTGYGARVGSAVVEPRDAPGSRRDPTRSGCGVWYLQSSSDAPPGGARQCAVGHSDRFPPGGGIGASFSRPGSGTTGRRRRHTDRVRRRT